MCLGVPMRVVSLSDENTARVEFLGGTCLEVRLDVCDRPPEVGDYVIIHAGYAIHWIDPEEARATQALFAELLRHQEEAGDASGKRPTGEGEGPS
ncbi:MAG: HypC/HybG/HupF family hydrogenase formation chaperone [Pseudomonadota bacterium]